MKTARILWALSVMLMTIGLILLGLSLGAGAAENSYEGAALTVDGVDYYPTKVVGSGPTVHYETPDTNPSSAVGPRHTWTGNGSEHLPCEGGIHWIENRNVLTISNCLEVATTTTSTIVVTTTSTVPPSSTTTTVPPSTTTTVPPVTTTSTVVKSTTTTSTPTTSTLPSTTTTTSPSTCDASDPLWNGTSCELPRTGVRLSLLASVGVAALLLGGVLVAVERWGR